MSERAHRSTARGYLHTYSRIDTISAGETRSATKYKLQSVHNRSLMIYTTFHLAHSHTHITSAPSAATIVQATVCVGVVVLVEVLARGSGLRSHRLTLHLQQQQHAHVTCRGRPTPPPAHDMIGLPKSPFGGTTQFPTKMTKIV